MVLDRPGKPFVEACFQKGFLINCTQETILRFTPPLIIDEEAIDSLLKVLRTCFKRQALENLFFKERLPMMKKDFLKLSDLTAGEIEAIWKRTKEYKEGLVRDLPLKGKNVGLLFEKPSTRTRVSFEVAIIQTGGLSRFYQQPGYPDGSP